MRLLKRALGLLAIPALLMACDPDEGLVCTTEFVYGVQVTAVDAATNAAVTDGLEGTLTEDGYVEEMRVRSNTLLGAGERAGTYALEVRANGYETLVDSGIVVTENECHVNPVSLLAEMTVDATGGS